MSELVLLKAIIEVRHNKDIELSAHVPKLTTIIKMSKKEFPQHNMELENNVLTLVNPNKRYQCIIDPNRIAIDIDAPSSINMFRNLFNETIKFITDEFGISNFERLGLRIFYGILHKDSEQASNCIKETFFKDNDEYFAQLGDAVSDYRMGFNARQGKYNVVYNFSPAAFQNIEIANNIFKSSSTKNYAMMDIDLYLETSTPVECVKDFVAEAIENAEQKTKIFFTMVKGV